MLADKKSKCTFIYYVIYLWIESILKVRNIWQEIWDDLQQHSEGDTHLKHPRGEDKEVTGETNQTNGGKQTKTGSEAIETRGKVSNILFYLTSCIENTDP